MSSNNITQKIDNAVLECYRDSALAILAKPDAFAYPNRSIELPDFNNVPGNTPAEKYTNRMIEMYKKNVSQPFVIDVYFVDSSKHHILVEKWVFTYTRKDDHKEARMNIVDLKFNTFLRSLKSFIRLLPAFQLSHYVGLKEISFQISNSDNFASFSSESVLLHEYPVINTSKGLLSMNVRYLETLTMQKILRSFYFSMTAFILAPHRVQKARSSSTDTTVPSRRASVGPMVLGVDSSSKPKSDALPPSYGSANKYHKNSVPIRSGSIADPGRRYSNDGSTSTSFAESPSLMAKVFAAASPQPTSNIAGSLGDCPTMTPVSQPTLLSVSPQVLGLNVQNAMFQARGESVGVGSIPKQSYTGTPTQPNLPIPSPSTSTPIMSISPANYLTKFPSPFSLEYADTDIFKSNDPRSGYESTLDGNDMNSFIQDVLKSSNPMTHIVGLPKVPRNDSFTDKQSRQSFEFNVQDDSYMSDDDDDDELERNSFSMAFATKPKLNQQIRAIEEDYNSIIPLRNNRAFKSGDQTAEVIDKLNDEIDQHQTTLKNYQAIFSAAGSR